MLQPLGEADWRLAIGVISLLTLAGGLLAEIAGRDGPFLAESVTRRVQ